MSKDPTRMVGIFGVLLGVWMAVFWLWGPSAPRISFGDRPDGFSEPAGGETPNPRPLTSLDRAAPPPSPPEPAASDGRLVVEKPRFRNYTVRKGDTSFEAVAARPEVYGNKRLATAIREANPYVSPEKLLPGKTVLRIPIDPSNVSGKIVELPPPGSTPSPAGPTPARPTPAGSNPAGSTPAASNPPVPRPAAPASDSPRGTSPSHSPPAPPAPPAAAPTTVYTVTSGDTLSGIAKKHYGKSALWTIILEANSDVLDDPAKLKAGMKLRIPPAPKE